MRRAETTRGSLKHEIYYFCRFYQFHHKKSVSTRFLRESPVSNVIQIGRNIIVVINIKDWTLWSFPSPQLQLLAPTLLRSSNCYPSLWSVVVWFHRDSVLWHSLQGYWPQGLLSMPTDNSHKSWETPSDKNRSALPANPTSSHPRSWSLGNATLVVVEGSGWRRVLGASKPRPSAKGAHRYRKTGMFGSPEVSYHQTYSTKDWLSILRTSYPTQNLQRGSTGLVIHPEDILPNSESPERKHRTDSDGKCKTKMRANIHLRPWRHHQVPE